MIISINAGKSGWSKYVTGGWGKYVLKGTKQSPRNTSKVHILDGNISLGEHISKQSNYKENYYRIVLSFKGKMPLNVMSDIYYDFKKLFMYGFHQDEYHIDAVIHTDTDNDHIHIRVPKLNIKTGTQLRLYIDRLDRKRLELIRNYLDIKYKLESPLDNKKIIAKSEEDYLLKWKEKHGQKNVDFSKKKHREQAQMMISNYLFDLHQSGLLNSFSDLKKALEQLDMTIEREGHDKREDFYYLTVSNETGKIRLKGDIYGKSFWEYQREDREKQIRDNTSFRHIKKRNSVLDRQGIQRALATELEQRKQRVEKRYRSARQKAEGELERLRDESSEAFSANKVDANTLYKHIHDNTHNVDSHRVQERKISENKSMVHTEQRMGTTRNTKNARELQSHTQEGLDNAKPYRAAYKRIREEREKRSTNRNESRKSIYARNKEDRKSVYEQITSNRTRYIEQIKRRRHKQQDLFRSWFDRTFRRHRQTIENIGTKSIELSSSVQQLIGNVQSVIDRTRHYREFITKMTNKTKCLFNLSTHMKT